MKFIFASSKFKSLTLAWASRIFCLSYKKKDIFIYIYHDYIYIIYDAFNCNMAIIVQVGTQSGYYIAIQKSKSLLCVQMNQMHVNFSQRVFFIQVSLCTVILDILAIDTGKFARFKSKEFKISFDMNESCTILQYPDFTKHIVFFKFSISRKKIFCTFQTNH